MKYFKLSVLIAGLSVAAASFATTQYTRSYTFNNSTSHTFTLVYQPGSCVYATGYNDMLAPHTSKTLTWKVTTKTGLCSTITKHMQVNVYMSALSGGATNLYKSSLIFSYSHIHSVLKQLNVTNTASGGTISSETFLDGHTSDLFQGEPNYPIVAITAQSKSIANGASLPIMIAGY